MFHAMSLPTQTHLLAAPPPLGTRRAFAFRSG